MNDVEPYIEQLFYPLRVIYISENDCYRIIASTGTIDREYQITRSYLLAGRGDLIELSENIKRRLDNEIKREIHKQFLSLGSNSQFMGYEIIVSTMIEDGKGKLIVSPHDYDTMRKEMYCYTNDRIFSASEISIKDWKKEVGE